jgi:tyrosyl-tRNA synthetase
MRNVFEVLKERGFIEQMTHPEQIENLLANERVSIEHH